MRLPPGGRWLPRPRRTPDNDPRVNRNRFLRTWRGGEIEKKTRGPVTSRLITIARLTAFSREKVLPEHENENNNFVNTLALLCLRLENP
ncbi:hypothetical protein CEXT_463571 [Caerostris extrusa]|uniref:Uncharacterized protein n=1 Tax=Caerostris extrusa TaxID=172846 RepID=A0AAV4UPD3_CAEEX|nr:hypothetical protein CEXT_463571 [Caerostris extrusa]